MISKAVLAKNNLAVVRSLIEQHSLQWAIGLPETLFDESAIAFLKDPANDPVDLVSEVNLFDIDRRLAEVNALFDLVIRLRTDGLSKELALYNEVLSADADRVTHEARKRIAVDAAIADWKRAGSEGSSPKQQVESVFKKAESDRNQREVFRGTPGHPFNLIEQITEYRLRYQKEMRTLLARAEGIKVVLRECFGIRIESLRDAIFATTIDEPNPLPKIVDWLRLVTRKLRRSELSQRQRTIYRLFSEDQRWTNQNIPELFKANKRITFPVVLNDKTLELQPGEKARLIKIGVAVVYAGGHEDANIDIIAQNSPARMQARSFRSTFSYDFSVKFGEITLTDKLPEGTRDFKSPAVNEHWSGVGNWARDTGSLEQSIELREIPLVTNRPAGMEFDLVIDENVRTVNGRKNYNASEFGWHLSEMLPTDVAIGLTYVVYRDEETGGE
jgi:hypothetical protein